MDTTTSFDLNAHVQRWRKQLAQSPAFRESDLDELESHLQDSIATLQSTGLSPKEAFLTATARLGDCQSITHEFEKSNREVVWATRVMWMILGIFAFWIISSAASIAASISRVCLGLTHTVNGHLWGIIPEAAFWCATVACWFFAAKLVVISNSDENAFVSKLARKPILFTTLLILFNTVLVFGVSFSSIYMMKNISYGQTYTIHLYQAFLDRALHIVVLPIAVVYLLHRVLKVETASQKTNRHTSWVPRAKWMLIGILAYFAIGFAEGFGNLICNASPIVTFKTNSISAGVGLLVIGALSMVLAWVFAAKLVLTDTDKSRDLGRKWLKKPIGLGALLVGGGLALRLAQVGLATWTSHPSNTFAQKSYVTMVYCSAIETAVLTGIVLPILLVCLFLRVQKIRNASPKPI